MGLSASQARLLTITARKSDCEFQSMRYSHEKIALSRNMTDISNEYQNSLNQTKLVYDFYGNGDTSTPLSYGLMMTPSELNGHLPILATNASGKVVLNSQFAAAARAAGIPQEGLGCLPSSTVRNNFYTAMATDEVGLISQAVAETCQGIQYSQEIGLGATTLVTTKTQEMNLTELIEYFKENSLGGTYQLNQDVIQNYLSSMQGTNISDVHIRNGANTKDLGSATVSIADILEGDYQLLLRVNNGTSDYDGRSELLENSAGAVYNLDVWDWMFDELSGMLNVGGDASIQSAISYAQTMTSQLLNKDNGYAIAFEGKTKENKSDGKWHGVIDSMNAGYNKDGWQMALGWRIALTPITLGLSWLFGDGDEGTYPTSNYIGVTKYNNIKTAKANRADGVSVDLTNIAKAFLTYFAQAMEGINKSEYYVSDNLGNRTVTDSHLIDDEYKFNIVTNQGINTDQGLISGFYDAIFNRICMNGWTENDNVNDKQYLQQMLQNGMLFLSTCNDDGYYYQTNYETYTFIREITDDEAIAKAEAKYNTEKQKINHKEEILDLKMKNLDTEISSLTTEYDTIKNVISKNIEKSFKRYDA